MNEYCKYCETEITEDFNEFPCCDEEKIDRLEKEHVELKKIKKDIETFDSNTKAWIDSNKRLEKENAELKKKKASLVLIIKDVIQSCVDNDLLVTAKEIEKQLKEQGEND